MGPLYNFSWFGDLGPINLRGLFKAINDCFWSKKFTAIRIVYFNKGYVISSSNLQHNTITIYNRITERKTSTTKQEHINIFLWETLIGKKTRQNFLSIDLSVSAMSSSTLQELNALPHKDIVNKTR